MNFWKKLFGTSASKDAAPSTTNSQRTAPVPQPTRSYKASTTSYGIMNKQELKNELLNELKEQLGSFAVNLVYMRVSDEANAVKCYERIISQGNSAPCTAYAVIGELRSNEGANPDIAPGLFVGAILHHWTLAALREGGQWFLNIASNYTDTPDSFVAVKDKNYAELEYLPFSFYKFKKVASSR